MTSLTREQQEIVMIVMSAAAGEATDEQLARISQLVIENEELRLFTLQLLSQEAWLAWHGSQARSDAPIEPAATSQFSRADTLVERATRQDPMRTLRRW